VGALAGAALIGGGAAVVLALAAVLTDALLRRPPVYTSIYNLGDFFAFPSLYEGFGLPVVEAMASGIAVLTSNTSSLGEIAGDAAETIDPTDTDAMADAIRRLAMDPELRRDRAERGLRRARTFSWAQTARLMMAVYHRAAGLRVASPATPPHAVEAAERSMPVESMSRSKLS